MEDKWLFFMRHNKLFEHRSWTGYLIFVIEINMDTNIHRVTINRDSNQVGIRPVEEDIESINAKAKAEILASTASVKLSDILSINVPELAWVENDDHSGVVEEMKARAQRVMKVYG